MRHASCFMNRAPLIEGEETSPMIQAIKDRVQCSRCGCIALPDATKCPKCGASYDRNGTRGIIDPITYFSSPTMGKDEDIQVIRAYYQFTCPRHGKVHVRATVIGSPVKCPFC